MRAHVVPALALAGAALFFGGCGDDDDDMVTVDSGTIADASVMVDARAIDARVADAAPLFDAAGSQFSGCGTGGTAFVDRTAAGASRSVTITINNTYDPKCMRIKQGQTVMIEAQTFHPLRAAVGNPGNELVNSTTTLTTALNSVGVYGYYCNIHGAPSGFGLAGAIEVVP